ncbi:MAG: hypothetical protein Q4C52_07540 [Eubacteriales bacterium]|nr:hypothetical protein [Eubacteriales bacterium]
MKKKIKVLLPCLLLFILVTGGGCEKKEAADDYLGRLITRAKETEGELSGVLEDGISDVKETEDLVVDFPEELKVSYEEFLKDALKQVQFELNKAEETGDHTYSVRVTYEPIDIAVTTESANLEYAENIASADFCAEVEALLEQDRAMLESAEKQQKKSRTITVTKSGDKFSIDEEEMKELLKDSLQGYMDPYAAVADVFDMRDFIQAYLDASLKGETARYQEHTGLSDEEAAAWYEDSFSEFKMDELSEEQNARLKNAAKGIFKSCQYTVGATKQVSLTEYIFDITITPNTSFLSVMSEFEGGTYYSESEAKEAFLTLYDKYASAPSYGEETTITVTWNAMNMMNVWQENEEYDLLMDTIVPME